MIGLPIDSEIIVPTTVLYFFISKHGFFFPHLLREHICLACKQCWTCKCRIKVTEGYTCGNLDLALPRRAPRTKQHTFHSAWPGSQALPPATHTMTGDNHHPFCIWQRVHYKPWKREIGPLQMYRYLHGAQEVLPQGKGAPEGMDRGPSWPEGLRSQRTYTSPFPEQSLNVVLGRRGLWKKANWCTKREEREMPFLDPRPVPTVAPRETMICGYSSSERPFCSRFLKPQSKQANCFVTTTWFGKLRQFFALELPPCLVTVSSGCQHTDVAVVSTEENLS